MSKIDINTLTSDEIRKELNREKYNSKFSNLLKSTVYVLIVIAAIGALLATFLLPVLQLSTDSMSPKYNPGDIVVTIKTKNIKNGDVVAYYHGNKILIGRVIGISSDWIDIDEDGNIYVNGTIVNEDEYVQNKKTFVNDFKYPYQVGSAAYYILGELTLKEADDARWLTKDTIGDVKWLPADITILDKVKKKL